MNPINKYPDVPPMPEPDNPLRPLKPLIILAFIGLIGWQIYSGFASWLEENNMTFDDWIATIDEEGSYDYDDDEQAPEKTPVDAVLESYLNNTYGDSCAFKGKASAEIEGYTASLFTCEKVIGHDVFAYGKLDEFGDLTDAHDGYLYSYYADDVANIMRTANSALFRSSTTQIVDSDEQLSNSIYMSNINHTNYISFVRGYEHIYNFSVDIDVYTDKYDASKIANASRITCGAIPNYTATYVFDDYRTGEQARAVANCNNGSFTVE